MGLLLLMGGGEVNPASLFANNEPGVWYDPSGTDGASEAKRTWRRNLAGFTEIFSDSSWTKTATTVSVNTSTNPVDGTLTADTLTETAATSAHNIQRSFTLEQGVTYTYSIYAKTNGRHLQFVISSAVVASGFANFDLTNGVNGSVSAGVTQAISNAGNGWYRLSITFTAGAGGSQTFNIGLVTTSSSVRGESYLGDGTSGLFIVAAQFEIGSLTTYQRITDFNSDFLAAYPTHNQYQDSTGTIPAVYPGDPVGLVLDKSRGGLGNLGPESTPTIYSGAISGSWAIGSNTITRNGSSTGQASLTLNSTLSTAKFYVLTFTVSNLSGDTFGFRLGGAGAATQISANGTYRYRMLATGNNANIIFIPWAGTAGQATIDNISIREIPGTHRYQTVSGSRKLLARIPDGGRRNLLTNTDSMSTQSVTVTAAQHTLSFQGTGTVTLSGVSTSGPLVGTGAANVVSLTFTPTAGSLTLTVSGSVTFAQLELGASRTVYQKVTVNADVTESGKRDCWGWLYDGSDDSDFTPSIDFSGTDKMTVWAGVRKLSDAASAVVCELTADYASNNGSFVIFAPLTADPNFTAGYKGNSTSRFALATGFAQPITRVVTGLMDISGASLTTRVNSASVATNTNTTGSGNFANAAIYFGRRNNASLPFNGIEFGTIIRGAQSTDSQIRDFEKYLARKAGITI